MDDLPAEDYEMEESESGEHQDRLSELPHSLILHILSFLRMRDVVSTTLLSKRWKNLWTTVPCLNFYDYTDEDNGAERIRNFVNRALIFWKGTKIFKFKIDIDSHFDMSLASDIDLWVRFAVENHVEVLNIDLMYEPDAMDWEDNAIINSKKDVYRTPQCLNSCSSIKKLSLVGCNLRIHGSPPWDQLKSLRIDGFCFSERLINQVLCGTPQLEVFTLRLLESHENLNIRSRSLKKLKIEKYLFYSDDQPSTDTVLRIRCPNIETLEILGALYCKCLLKNVSSLIAATLGFDGSHYYDNRGLCGKELLGETLRQIFPTIRHVERVTLSDWCVQVLGASQKKYSLSPLSNVEFLKLVDISFIKLDQMMHLLGIFPKLKTLVIEDMTFFEDQSVREQRVVEPLEFDAENYVESESNLPKSFLLQLRTVEVTSCLCGTSIFPFIEFLLKHASMLEKMVILAIGISSLPQEDLFLVAEELLSMPRSSPSAKVILCKN